jgi:hypothetical protein
MDKPVVEAKQDRAYDPALFGELKEMSSWDLLVIQMKHYRTKFVNSKFYLVSMQKIKQAKFLSRGGQI